MLELAIDSLNNQSLQDFSTILPPEISSLVCGFLRKDTLKQVRQVSRIWERAAVPYLFDQIFISQDMADFRIAKLLIHQFRYHIRTLLFSSIYYEKVSRQTFRNECIRAGMFMKSNIDFDKDHFDHAFTVYRTMRIKKQESITNGTTLAYLSFALTSLPNIQKIILTDISSSRSMPHQLLQVYQPWELKACPIGDCDLSPADHVPDDLRGTGFLRKDSTNPWRLVLSALSTTKANVRELNMATHNLYVGTDSAAFSMSPWGLSQAILSFRNLTKLGLFLIGDTKQFTNDVDTHRVHENVAKLLSNAINLESLSLDLPKRKSGTRSSCPLFQDILGQCKFPKLRSLILAFFASSDEELLRLLNHSKRLERIIIEHFTLTTGSWMRVADWIRASLPLLKHAKLTPVYGGFDKPIDGEKYCDWYGGLDKFLFASGENPFTEEALGKYLADKAAGGPNFDGWLGYVGAYNEYH